MEQYLVGCLLLLLFGNGASEPTGTSDLSDSTSNRNTSSDVNKYVESTLHNQTLKCEGNITIENEYIVLGNGSLLLPQNDSLYSNDTYTIQNSTVYICTMVKDVEENGRIVEHSEEFLNCTYVLIEHHEFELVGNATIYVKDYRRYYGPRDYSMQEHGVYICLPNYDEMIANLSDPSVYDNTKFAPAFAHVTRVCLGISIISLILHLLVFCLVAKVRNLPGCCLASLSLSLLLAYLCFVSTSAATTDFQCSSLGLCIYYFFLTSFFWMNAIAFDVWRSFRVVMRELRISSHRVPWRRFLIYSVYSWLSPAVLAILAKVADTTEIFPEDYRPSFGSSMCWFGNRKALMVFFATPLCVIMTLNAVFFLDSAYVINRATIKTSSQVEKAVLTQRFFMFMRLALLMGLTWIIGIIAGYANLHFLWYIFVVLNTLQGLFIFIVFSCSSKVRIFSKLRGHIHKRQSTSVRTISQASGAL